MRKDQLRAKSCLRQRHESQGRGAYSVHLDLGSTPSPHLGYKGLRLIEPDKVQRKPEKQFRFCEYHKEHRHVTDWFYQLQLLLESMFRRWNLHQYIRGLGLEEPNVCWVSTSVNPRPMIDTILVRLATVHAKELRVRSSLRALMVKVQ